MVGFLANTYVYCDRRDHGPLVENSDLLVLMQVELSMQFGEKEEKHRASIAYSNTARF